MKAVTYHGHEDFRVEKVADPSLLKDNDALIRVTRTAICGSDLHLWHAPDLPVTGFTMGHEFVGIVEDVGPGVQRFRKGDRVLTSCTTACGSCGLCTRGNYGGCQELTRNGPMTNVFGSPLLAGGQAEGVRVPYADVNLFSIPQRLDDEQVLFLTDILPTGYMGAELGEIETGDVVVVFGCGPVGVFAQRSAALFGPSAIVAVDLDAGRVELARQRGCIGVNPNDGDVAATVAELTDGRGADVVIEAVGNAQLVKDAMELARPGGRVSAIGVIMDANIEVPFNAGLMGKSLTLRSGIVQPQAYIPKLLPLVEQGVLDPTEIITHRLSLDDAIDGYRTFAAHDDGVLKVVLKP